MKHFIYRLEITDGEHQYYSSGLLQADSMDSAVIGAGRAAKGWYEGEKVKRISKEGEYPAYEFFYPNVICQVDQVEEIPAEDYEVLAKYPSYI